MILKPRIKQTWEFYTKTKEQDNTGEETLVATKVLKHPDKCKLYLDIQRKGFVNGIYAYGFRLIE